MKSDIIKNLIKKEEKKGVKELRVGGYGKQKPRSLGFNGNRKTFTPDLVALYEDRRDLFSVENKVVKSNIKDLIAKWILFGLEARKHGGRLYVVVPEKDRKKCEEIIEQKQLSAELITV
ncbi:MAG: hypothetical protein HUJ25_03715 [Crocinitomicaceae bacterium]|nr:hypothetical protein [Crocinitomicaceae bacterium]